MAINFLRQHYKLRPRSGTSGTRVVPKVHYYQGVTIDARLAYQQPDLNWFTATIEATSFATAHEVLFRTNWFRIVAFSLLAGLVSVLAVLALAQVQGLNLWAYLGGNAAFGCLALCFFLTGLLAGVVLLARKSFRYIYAIEQFKRFHAEAQWMAYDAELFRQTPPKYFQELKRQCVQYGFGMMEILPENRVRALIEPSHLDQFGGKRSRLPLWVAAVQPPPQLKGFIQRLPFPHNLAPAAAPTTKATKPPATSPYLPTTARADDYLLSLIRPTPGRPAWYRKPRRTVKRLRWKLRHAVRKLSPREIRRLPGFYRLPYWCLPALLCCLAGVAGMTYLQVSWSPTTTLGTEFEPPDIAGLEPAANPEQSLASSDLLPGEYDHFFSGKDRKPAAEYIDTRQEDVIAEAPPTVTRHRINQAGESRTDYNCIGLNLLPNNYFLLVTGRYPDFASARSAAEHLNTLYRLAVTVAAEECLRLGGGTYYVYLDAPIVEESQANFLVRAYQRKYDLQVEVLISE